MKRTALVFFVLLFGLVSCGNDSTRTEGEGPGGTPPAVGPDAASSPEWQRIAREPNKRNLIGSTVAIPGLRVQSVAGRYVLWAGPARGPDYPVVLVGAARAARDSGDLDVRTGAVVKITGAVADPGTLDAAADEGLGPRERSRIRAQEICFTAERIEISR